MQQCNSERQIGGERGGIAATKKPKAIANAEATNKQLQAALGEREVVLSSMEDV